MTEPTAGQQFGAAIDWKIADYAEPMPAELAGMPPAELAELRAVVDKGVDDIRAILASKGFE